MEKVYHKIAEQVMTTYKGDVMIPCGVNHSDGKTNYIKGFSIIGKKLGTERVHQPTYMMRMIIPMIRKKYAVDVDASKEIYNIISSQIKSRVIMGAMINELNKRINW